MSFPGRFQRVCILLALVLTLIGYPSLAYADEGWIATDSAVEYGLDPAVYQGIDDPDGTWYIYAPNPPYHDSFFFNYDNPSSWDWIWEGYMRWHSTAKDWFEDYPNYNLCWEVRSYINDAYEAEDYIQTNLPDITHNEDSPFYEEAADGYEEKEIGTLHPELLNSTTNYYLYTAWDPVIADSIVVGRFETEAELNEHRWTPWPSDWWPYHWNQTGVMWWDLSNSSIW